MDENLVTLTQDVPNVHECASVLQRRHETREIRPDIIRSQLVIYADNITIYTSLKNKSGRFDKVK